MNAYLQTLAAAWQAHLAPRAADALTVISTFAGYGGSSLGYSMTGYRELLAVERDQNAVRTFQVNFPGIGVYRDDIRHLTVAECLRLTGLTAGQLDVLDGSPPCQGFSTSGKREVTDERNQLYLEYVRLLRGLQPRAFVMENVSGMMKGEMRRIFTEILRALRESGYRVSTRILSAADYAVPQSRERLIFIGLRNDLHLQAQYPAPAAVRFTVADAFTDLADNPTERVRPKADSLTLRQLQRVKPGERCPEHRGRYRLAWDQPSPTIEAGGAVGGWHVWHPAEQRPITVSEAKRLMSFPDAFRILDAPGEAFVHLGNAVPPLLMSAVASQLRSTLNTVANRDTIV